MKKEIEAIRKHIEVLNHNSDSLREGIIDLKKDFKIHEKCFNDLFESHTETRTDVSWLKRISWYILTTIIFSTLMSVALGILFLMLNSR